MLRLCRKACFSKKCFISKGFMLSNFGICHIPRCRSFLSPEFEIDVVSRESFPVSAPEDPLTSCRAPLQKTAKSFWAEKLPRLP